MKKKIKLLYKILTLIHSIFSKCFIEVLETYHPEKLFITSIILLFVPIIINFIIIDLITIGLIDYIEKKNKEQELKENKEPWWKLKNYGGWI